MAVRYPEYHLRPDDENPLPLCNDHGRIADLKIALDCEVKLKGFGEKAKDRQAT